MAQKMNKYLVNLVINLVKNKKDMIKLNNLKNYNKRKEICSMKYKIMLMDQVRVRLVSNLNQSLKTSLEMFLIKLNLKQSMVMV